MDRMRLAELLTLPAAFEAFLAFCAAEFSSVSARVCAVCRFVVAFVFAVMVTSNLLLLQENALFYHRVCEYKAMATAVLTVRFYRE